jgi:hypothetical protein
MEQNKPWSYSKNKTFHMYLRFFARIVLMLSALLFASQLGGYNPSKYLMQNKVISFFIVLIVVASILYNMFNRNFYLPFLGWSVYPCGSLAEKIPGNSDTTVTIHVNPNVNVIYWASEPSSLENQPIDNPWDAYANYENSGVVRADATGKAILHFRNPSSYQVGLMNRTLQRHVHYRECRHPGMLSDIKTIFLEKR